MKNNKYWKLIIGLSFLVFAYISLAQSDNTVPNPSVVITDPSPLPSGPCATADTDNDGILDVWEMRFNGDLTTTDDLTTIDSDNNGYPDSDEVRFYKWFYAGNLGNLDFGGILYVWSISMCYSGYVLDDRAYFRSHFDFPPVEQLRPAL